MDDTYFIRVGAFQAVLLKDHLTEMTRPQFRKLLRLALTEPENRPMLDAMRADIRNRVAEAEAARKTAAWDYQTKWKHVAHPRSRKPEIVKIVDENRRLKEVVQKTASLYDNWVSVQAIFEKECS